MPLNITQVSIYVEVVHTISGFDRLIWAIIDKKTDKIYTLRYNQSVHMIDRYCVSTLILRCITGMFNLFWRVPNWTPNTKSFRPMPVPRQVAKSFCQVGNPPKEKEKLQRLQKLVKVHEMALLWPLEQIVVATAETEVVTPEVTQL